MKDNYDEIAEPRHLYDSLLQGPLPMQSCNVQLDNSFNVLEETIPRFDIYSKIQFTKSF